MFKLFHYEAYIVGKQAVGILLEYFLVCSVIYLILIKDSPSIRAFSQSVNGTF